jgi:hypothetical protein
MILRIRSLSGLEPELDRPELLELLLPPSPLPGCPGRFRDEPRVALTLTLGINEASVVDTMAGSAVARGTTRTVCRASRAR